MNTAVSVASIASATAVATPLNTIAAEGQPHSIDDPIFAAIEREEPTAIGRLWIEAQAAAREYKITRRQYEKLREILEREMPDPDPSIVWGSPENVADGLVYWVEGRESPYFKHYIFSGWLETKLTAANEPTLAKVIRSTKEKNGRRRVTVESRETGDVPFPVTQEQLALRERLAKRLEMSRQYEQQKKRVSRRIGLTAAEKKLEQACEREGRLLHKILRLRASTRSDFRIKCAIYRKWDDTETAGMILRDIDRLVVAA